MKGRKAGGLSARPPGRCERAGGPSAQCFWLLLSSSDLWDDELQCILLHPDHVAALPGHPRVQNGENQL